MSYARNEMNTRPKSTIPVANRNQPPAERALIASIRQRAQSGLRTGLTLGIGDDCALFRPRRGEELALTTDLALAGRHFRLDWHQPESVGHRTLARGLSDLAAMGARPVAAFLSLGLPPELTVGQRGRASWADRFYDGLLGLAAKAGVPLGGGDLSQSPLVLADIVLVGAVPCGQAMLRSGARAGDLLYVTGQLGAAACGLRMLGSLAAAAQIHPPRVPKAQAELFAAHTHPQPRLAQGQRLRKLATAALDISDGLSTDLGHICNESGVHAVVHAERLPLAAQATLDDALHGGEDYELLFAAPAAVRMPRQIAGVAITRIGHFIKPRAGQAQMQIERNGALQPLERSGWQHFSAS